MVSYRPKYFRCSSDFKSVFLAVNSNPSRETAPLMYVWLIFQVSRDSASAGHGGKGKIEKKFVSNHFFSHQSNQVIYCVESNLQQM
jgi:hypothetical protein